MNASWRGRAARGFTLAGTLSGLAVAAVLVAVCVPIVASRVERRARDAGQSLDRAKASIAGILDDLAAEAPGSGGGAALAGPAQGPADSGSPWCDTCPAWPPMPGFGTSGDPVWYFPAPRRLWLREPGPAWWGWPLPPAGRAGARRARDGSPSHSGRP